MIGRRSFLTGLASLFAAPAVIRTVPLYGRSPAVAVLQEARELLIIKRYDYLEYWESLALQYLPQPAKYLAPHPLEAP